MATDATGTRTVHNTLSSTTVDTVTLQGHWAAVEIVNRETSGSSLWVTIGQSAPPQMVPATPVAAANETFEVPVGTAILVDASVGASTQVQVKILGNGNAYSVIGHTHA